MHRSTRLKITELNPHLICKLCNGYLIDASTLMECCHSFCRTCILKYVMERKKQCPVCEMPIHKTKPLNNIRPDKTKQNLVYKLVPNLFKAEMKRRRDFYAEHPEAGASMRGPNANELRGAVGDLPILTNEEQISLSLEYYLPMQEEIIKDQPSTSKDVEPKKRMNGGTIPVEVIDRRYLRCPAAVCIVHIKKFIRYKFGLPTTYRIEVMHKADEEEALYDHYSLMDIAYIFNWRRRKPLPLTYRVYEPNKRRKTDASKVASTISEPKPEPVAVDVTSTTVKSLSSQKLSEQSCATASSSSTSKTMIMTTPTAMKKMATSGQSQEKTVVPKQITQRPITSSTPMEVVTR